jgi:enolase-phosphatase E1
MKFSGRGILLDIEGTTSSVSFVYDVMFPFVRRELDKYLCANWDSVVLNEVCDLIAKDAGYESFTAWCGTETEVGKRQQLLRAEVLRLMDGDVKATGLKALQGLIWQSGFESGEMRAHIYDDVLPAIQAWNDAGCDVRIFSSGSIAAQKLFFGHTAVGNILHLFRGHYDTTTGPKKEAASYQAIAKDFGLPPAQILFLSDVPDELEAARAAGLPTGLCKRPGNAKVAAGHGHPEITSFNQVELSRGG